MNWNKYYSFDRSNSFSRFYNEKDIYDSTDITDCLLILIIVILITVVSHDTIKVDSHDKIEIDPKDSPCSISSNICSLNYNENWTGLTTKDVKLSHTKKKSSY